MSKNRPEAVLKDLIERELLYLKCLQAILHIILQPLRDAISLERPIITTTEIERLFSSSLNSFLALSQSIFYELVQVQDKMEKAKDPSLVKEVGNVFVKQGELLKCYNGYAKFAHDAIPILNNLTKKNKKFQAFLKDKYTVLKVNNIYDDLVSLLIRPSRQIILYMQFLESFIKDMGDVEPLSSGLKKIKAVLDFIGKSAPNTSSLPASIFSASVTALTERAKRSMSTREFATPEKGFGISLPTSASASSLSSFGSPLPSRESASGLSLIQSGPISIPVVENSELQKLKMVQERLVGRINILDNLTRAVIFQDNLGLFEGKGTSNINLILFNDSVLISIPHSDKLYMERFVPLDRVSLVQDEEILKIVLHHIEKDKGDQQPSKPVFQLDAFGFIYSFIASSHRAKVSWIDQITQTKANYLNANQKTQQPPKPTDRLIDALGSLSARSDDSLGEINISTREDSKFSVEELVNEAQTFQEYPRLVVQIQSRLNPATKAYEPIVGSVIPTYNVGKSGAYIGREVDTSEETKAFILVVDDENISRRKPGRPAHGEIVFDANKNLFSVRDLGSANHTFMIDSKTGKSIKKLIGGDEGVVLKVGDLFQMGGTRFIVQKIELDESQKAKLQQSGSPAPQTKSGMDISNLITKKSKPASKFALSKDYNTTIRVSPLSLGLTFDDEDDEDSPSSSAPSSAPSSPLPKSFASPRSEKALDGPARQSMIAHSPGQTSKERLSVSGGSQMRSEPAKELPKSASSKELTGSKIARSDSQKELTGSKLAPSRTDSSKDLQKIASRTDSSKDLSKISRTDSSKELSNMAKLTTRTDSSKDLQKSLLSTSKGESRSESSKESSPKTSGRERKNTKKVSWTQEMVPGMAEEDGEEGESGGSGIDGRDANKEQRARSVELFVGSSVCDDNIRGRIMVTSDSTILSIRNDIWNTMLEQNEKDKFSKADQLPLKVNGRIPVRTAQNHVNAFDFFIPASDTTLLVPIS